MFERGSVKLGRQFEVCHATRRRIVQSAFLSRAAVSAAEASPRRPKSNAAAGSFTATKNSAKNWGGTTCARAAPDGAFKKCCMQSGLFDGSRRNHFFRKWIPIPAQERLSR